MSVREDFEATVIREAGKHGMLCDLTKDSAGDYRSACERSAWWSWQASRASLVIELPQALDAKPYACYEGGWNDMREESFDAITAAGLKVKP